MASSSLETSLGSYGMGSWRNNGTAPTIVVSPYKVYTGDKRPYSLTYADIMSMVKAHPQSQIYDKTSPAQDYVDSGYPCA